MHLPSSLALLLATSVSTVFAKCDTSQYHYQKSTDLSFSPTTFTLIATKDEAVLVDAPISPERGEELADWIEATIPSRKLTGIYVTHGHGDHFFAIACASHGQL
ncbi:hypothetical protein CNMCM8980_000391 [Aspergillus fumigatiaffinis]|uniref:Metallo-beta-lactamase domain-containing protein n=1 Tax=Aspergillus fumigatiaffinis TaxID=340414 RepID=A0A8H4MDD6_9EURO|nr:hypothetical protein CNMCM5878_000464 [Aspergillus fumigatiaffinis]KAF4233377.1 hypothetical protein CNMCM6457_004535 [Aspergillus fumigatiaffinis]KAF4242063.1 hypothetical protein CNMCM6805_003178 [Aspergillus fumigatiaffinis]KAF4250561.1 hypothetical protein CNMCM8980_000391 [Aspergillus fumigatiaffinis]